MFSTGRQLFVMDYLYHIIMGVMVCLASFYAGWKLRGSIPEKKRFGTGFLIVLVVLTLTLIVSLCFEIPLPWKTVSAATTGFSVGFMIGVTQS